MVLHLTATDDPPRVDPLARFFAEMWQGQRDYLSIPCDDLQELMVESGLAEWRPATEADADRFSEYDVDVGDPVITLTVAGRAAIEAAKG